MPTLAPEDVQSVVDDVAGVQPFWASLPLADRARYMRRAGQAIIDGLDELAELLAQLELSTEDSRDELLTDFLIRPYPTKSTQDN